LITSEAAGSLPRGAAGKEPAKWDDVAQLVPNAETLAPRSPVNRRTS
jgi:hypothetical protein